MRKVIAVAAPVGGGKSSLTDALAALLGDAPVLRFDDYQQATRQSVEELEAWLAAGADFNTLHAPGLVEQLDRLRSDAGQGEWLVFEMPLGRAYRATAGAIDMLVWLDVPLDVALARKLRELAASARSAPLEDARAALQWIDDYLGHYIATVRKVLQAQRERVAPMADVVLDGCVDTNTLARQVLTRIRDGK